MGGAFWTRKGSWVVFVRTNWPRDADFLVAFARLLPTDGMGPNGCCPGFVSWVGPLFSSKEPYPVFLRRLCREESAFSNRGLNMSQKGWRHPCCFPEVRSRDFRFPVYPPGGVILPISGELRSEQASPAWVWLQMNWKPRLCVCLPSVPL